MVYDAKGLSSGWSTTQTFRMNGHPAPNPDFAFNPNTGIKPRVTEVTFTDQSICYRTSGTYFCRTGGSDVTYTWNFNDGSPYDYTKGNPKHVYNTKEGVYAAQLKVCDDGGCCYSPAYAVPVGVQGTGNLPSWREISPF